MMKNLTLLTDETVDREPLATFESDFKGVDYFHIRRVYRDRMGQWSPTGKGFSVPVADKQGLIDTLAALKVPAKRKPAAKPARDEANPPDAREHMVDAMRNEG
jgi:hypothetical protein